MKFRPTKFSKSRSGNKPCTAWYGSHFFWPKQLPEAIEHARAGVEAQKQGRLDAAIEEFRKVTQVAPDLPAAFVNLGAAYVQKRDYALAIPAFERALALNPDLIGAHQMLGTAFLAVGNAGQAIPHLEKVQERTALGFAQIGAGQLQPAVENLQAALAQHPNDPDLLYYLGRASGLLSKQSIDTLLAAYPDSARAHQALAENYYVSGPMPGQREFLEALRLRRYPGTAPGTRPGLCRLGAVAEG